jgi:hypothetical protein
MIPTFTVNGKGLVTAAGQTTITAPASGITGIVNIVNGGTGASTASAAFNNLNPMTTTGDIIYESSNGVANRLGVGATNAVLTVSAGVPSWVTPASVTSGAAVYYMSGTGNVFSSGSQLNFDQKETDPLNLCTTGASWKCTANTAGVWCLAGTTSVTSGYNNDIILYKNGTAVKYWQTPPSASVSVGGIACTQLNSGDYVDLRPDASMTINGVVSSIERTHVSFYLLPSIASANVTNRGTGNVYIDAAQVTCSSSSSIVSQINSSSWISAIGNISSGACSVTIGSYSATPYCWAANNVTSGTSQFVVNFSASSSSAANVSCTDNGTIGTACTSFTTNVYCMGTH